MANIFLFLNKIRTFVLFCDILVIRITARLFTTYHLLRVADSNAQAEFISAEHETVSFERVLREERTVFPETNLDG